MDLKDRIKQVRKSVNLNQADFGQRVGVKGNTIGNYEIGLRTPSDAVILSICREFGVSETWLRTGDGEMFIRPDPDDEIDRILAQISASDDELIRRIIRAYWRLDQKEKAAISKLIDGLCENRNTPGE